MTLSNGTPTREKILFLLHSKGPLSISDFAEALGVTQISIRHHMNSLQADGLIESREERHGVGRPRLVFRLTEIALDRNPTKYYKLTNLLLGQLKEQLPREMMDKLLGDVATCMADDLKQQLADLPMEQRVEKLAQLLSEEGYIARMEEKSAGEFQLVELSCPYQKISLQHPEMCVIDASIIANALGADVERTTCIRTGSDSCTFSIMQPKRDAS